MQACKYAVTVLSAEAASLACLYNRNAYVSASCASLYSRRVTRPCIAPTSAPYATRAASLGLILSCRRRRLPPSVCVSLSVLLRVARPVKKPTTQLVCRLRWDILPRMKSDCRRPVQGSSPDWSALLMFTATSKLWFLRIPRFTLSLIRSRVGSQGPLL